MCPHLSLPGLLRPQDSSLKSTVCLNSPVIIHWDPNYLGGGHTPITRLSEALVNYFFLYSSKF